MYGIIILIDIFSLGILEEHLLKEESNNLILTVTYTSEKGLQ